MIHFFFEKARDVPYLPYNPGEGNWENSLQSMFKTISDNKLSLFFLSNQPHSQIPRYPCPA